MDHINSKMGKFAELWDDGMEVLESWPPAFPALHFFQHSEGTPGTKHSTMTALTRILSPGTIRRGGSKHISKAIERYFLPYRGKKQVQKNATKNAPQANRNGNQHR